MSRQQIVGGLIKGLWKQPGAGRCEACGCRGRGATGCGDRGRGGMDDPSGCRGALGSSKLLLLDWNSLCCLHRGEGRLLTLWSQMPGLLQDQLCQIQTDTNPKADTQTCLEKRKTFYIHSCLSLIKNMSHVNQMWFALLMPGLWLGGESGNRASPSLLTCPTSSSQPGLPTCSEKCQEKLKKSPLHLASFSGEELLGEGKWNVHTEERPGKGGERSKNCSGGPRSSESSFSILQRGRKAQRGAVIFLRMPSC